MLYCANRPICIVISRIVGLLQVAERLYKSNSTQITGYAFGHRTFWEGEGPTRNIAYRVRLNLLN